MPVDFTNSQTESAVEEIVRTKNGKEKTVSDVFDVVLAVNHDSVNRDREIILSARTSMTAHMEACHKNDNEVITGMRAGRWAVTLIVGALLMFGVSYVTSNLAATAAEKGETEKIEQLQQQIKAHDADVKSGQKTIKEGQ